MPRRFLCLVALAAVGLASPDARAGKYDIDLTPLGRLPDGQVDVVQDNAAFRSLASEVGVLMAPKPVDPADSLGLSGFAVAADISINTISADADYWTQTAEGTPGTAVPTIQVYGRKGLWPGLEVGGGATKLLDSRMWTMGGYGKLAIHEGFHHLPIPSIAIRGMFSQLLGSKDLKMTTASVDASLSHVFGIGHTFSITPYAGYQMLMVSARSGVLDATPGVDEYDEGTGWNPPDPCVESGADNPNNLPQCLNSEFVFQRQDLILRHRPFVGFRVIFSVIRFGFEAMFATGGNTTATVGGEEVADSSGLQQQYTVSVGLDF